MGGRGGSSFTYESIFSRKKPALGYTSRAERGGRLCLSVCNSAEFSNPPNFDKF